MDKNAVDYNKTAEFNIIICNICKISLKKYFYYEKVLQVIWTYLSTYIFNNYVKYLLIGRTWMIAEP